MTTELSTGRLAKPAKHVEDRKSWTPQQHCEHANRQLIENGTNIYRRKMGLFPVKWVLVNDRVTITEGEPRVSLQITHAPGSKPLVETGTGSIAKQREPDQRPNIGNYPTKPVE